eukprot:5169759-Pleurochrysis_carterae.AAC.4
MKHSLVDVVAMLMPFLLTLWGAEVQVYQYYAARAGVGHAHGVGELACTVLALLVALRWEDDLAVGSQTLAQEVRVHAEFC